MLGKTHFVSLSPTKNDYVLSKATPILDKLPRAFNSLYKPQEY